MKNYFGIWRTGLILTVLASLLAACAAPAPNPEEILVQGRTAMKAVTSSHFTMELQISDSNGLQKISGDGNFVLPGKSDMKMASIADPSQGGEVLFLEPGIIHQKSSADNVWKLFPIPKDDLLTNLFANMSRHQQDLFEGVYSAPQLVGEETVGSVTCYHIQFPVDTQKYLDSIMKERNTKLDYLSPTVLTFQADLWIGKADHMLYKSGLGYKTNFGSGQNNGSMSLVTVQSNFNQPVTLPNPIP